MTAILPAVPPRYSIERLCGQGGSGSVYRAWDRELARTVALKFLRDDRPEHRARMLREARAQARIDHPNVCKVFDVGEYADRLYIAMQWIDGESLGTLAPRLTIEEKIGIVRDVADGVHAGHAQGIIHRDIKPANILVERRDDGSLHPYVVDYGLARALDEARSTATGDILGTPHYLSPEQAWGFPVDRRTDVYSLGATMYELLSGDPPFGGDSAADVVMQVITRPAPSLRRTSRSIPRDLSVITLNCLEKQPERRYDSARALRDDLVRWLRGEPITARPPSLLYRAHSILRRHRRTAVGIAIATVATGSVGAYWIAELQREREHQHVTAALEDRARYVERLLEHDRSLPLHDTRPMLDRAIVEIESFDDDLREGEPFRASFDYSEGRAMLAIGQISSAREALDRAWKGGLRSGAVAYHLGAALAGEYADALDAADRIPQEELRRLRIDELRDRYHASTLPVLAVARGYLEQPAALIDARIASIEGDNARTAELAGSVLDRFPWNNDARLVRAEAFVREAREDRLAGELKRAGEALEKARQIYEEARLTAPSDVRVLDGLCRCDERLLQIAYETGGDEPAAFEAARVSCENALVSDAGHVSSWITLSSAWTRLAFYRGTHGGDDEEARLRAIEMAEKALELVPDDPAALIQAGSAYFWMPLAHAPHVTELMRKAVAADPGSVDAHHGLGRALLRLNDWMQSQGEDPRAVLHEAIGEYRFVIGRASNYTPAYTNLGFVLNNLAEYAVKTGADPEPYYRQMLEMIEPRLAASPEVTSVRYIAGIAWHGRARVRQLSGVDPMNEIARARQQYDEAIRLNPEYLLAIQARSLASMLEAEVMSDPAARRAALEAAGRDLDRAERIMSGPVLARVEWNLIAADATENVGEGLQHLEAAEAVLDDALERFPDNVAPIWLARGRIEYARCRIAPSRCDAGEAEAWLQRALVINPLLRVEAERFRIE